VLGELGKDNPDYIHHLKLMAAFKTQFPDMYHGYIKQLDDAAKDTGT
jgi:hypothetical protein